MKCLPGDLVSHFTVSISELKEFGDSISVKDLIIPKGIEILNDPETTVVTISAPRTEEVKTEEEVKPGEVPTTAQSAVEATDGEAKEGEDKKEG